MDNSGHISDLFELITLENILSQANMQAALRRVVANNTLFAMALACWNLDKGKTILLTPLFAIAKRESKIEWPWATHLTEGM